MSTPRSPSSDFYGIFGIQKTACKAYKSLMKWHRHPSHNQAEADFAIDNKHHDEPTTPEGFRLRSMDDSSVFKRRSSFLSRTGSRRSHTPQARPTYLSSPTSSSTRRTTASAFSPPKTSPSSLYRSTSRRGDEGSLKSRPLSKSTSRRERDDAVSPIKGVASPLTKSTSRRKRDDVTSPVKGVTSSPSFSKSASRRERDDPVSPIKGVASSSSSTLSKSASTSLTPSSVPLSKNMSLGGGGGLPPEIEVPVMGRSTSRRSTTPIVFSQSVARRKPPPIERKLECTLEELCNGSVKNIKITRDVLTDEGIIVQKEEMLRINIQSGWKKGTKIAFEGKGNEKPGYLPADIIFFIEEKRHPLFKRQGDDLEIAVEIPLLKALTGCTLSVPLLDGEKMALSIGDIIFPGFEKAIKGQGMPNAKEEGRRGDLRITFLVNFPKELSNEQRSMAYDVLKECSWS